MTNFDREMSQGEAHAVTVRFDPEEYERLEAITDSPVELLHEAALDRIDVAEAVEFTAEGGFHGPQGFARMMDEAYPSWPLGSLLGIELQSMGDGESRWVLETGPEMYNPMGTLHGGVLCDLGDAALSTAYMSTLEPGESFATVDLRVNFLAPVRSERLEAVGRVIHEGGTVGVCECDITNGDGQRVARLSGTCMTRDGGN